MWHLVDAVVSAFLSQRSVSCNVGILQPFSCLFLLHQAISYHDLTLFSYLSLQNELLAGGDSFTLACGRGWMACVGGLRPCRSDHVNSISWLVRFTCEGMS